MVQLIVALTVLSVYLLMILGGLVTSTGSGLACPDWPLCYGTVAPPLKLDVWLEWSHRLLGGIAGLLILLSSILVWRRHRRLPRLTVGIASALLLLVVVLGGAVVLVDAPLLMNIGHTVVTSSHIIVSTLILISLVFTYSLIRSERAGAGGFPYAVPFLFLVCLQSFVGVVVRYGGAGLACPDFPLCQGSLVPPLGTFHVLIHFSHRVLAGLVFIFALAVFFKTRNARTLTALLLVSAQAAWGVLSVLTGLFLPVVFLHIATGFFLLAWLAYHAAPVLFLPPLVARESSA